jgi:hypothetical protein
MYDKKKIIWIIPIIPQIIFLLALFYYKIKSYLSINFNSFYLLIINIFSLLLFHLSFEIILLNSNKLFKLIFPMIFFFSYIIRIKRILDFLSLSKVLKSNKLKAKEKSKILYQKSSYSFELSYLIQLVIFSTIIIYISYIYKLAMNIKYIIEILSLIIIIFLIYKISTSDIKRKFKKSYSIEIIISYLLFSNCVISDMNFSQEILFYKKIVLYLTEIFYIILLLINCKICSSSHIFKQNCLINKKLNSDFGLFLNNDLCFYSFNNFIKKDSEAVILLKLYLDINSYTISSSLNQKSNEEQNIVSYINNNKQFINDKTLKELFEKIEETNKFDNIYNIIYTNLNRKFEEFKRNREYKKLCAFLDLIFYLDEFIFTKSFYTEYFENEQLDIINNLN